MEHTPKNLLIRAVKKGKTAQAENTAKTTRLDEMIKELNIHPTLEQLLYPESDKGGTL